MLQIQNEKLTASLGGRIDEVQKKIATGIEAEQVEHSKRIEKTVDAPAETILKGTLGGRRMSSLLVAM